MYTIKFYKNIIVSKDYDIVFDNMLYRYDQQLITTTEFEQYLNSNLNNTITFNDNEVYMPAPTGKLELDIKEYSKLVDYNYLSIEPQYYDEDTSTYENINIKTTFIHNLGNGNYNDTDNFYYNENIPYQTNANRQLKYYCFIDRIEHLNDVVIIYYTLDIFHTYTPFLNFFNGQLERTNVINKLINKNLSLFKIPNYKLDINEINNNRCIYNFRSHQDGFKKIDKDWIGDNYGQYYLFFKMSLYTLGQSGSLSARKTKIVSTFASGSLDTALTILNNLTSVSGTTQTSTNYHFQILDAYVIPTQLCDKFCTKAFDYAYNQNYITQDFSITNSGLEFKFFEISDAINEIDTREPTYEMQEIISFTPTKDIVQFGFMCRLFDVPFNSDVTSLIIKLKIDATIYDMSFTMGFGNQTIDILDLFTIEPTIDPLDASAISIARYTREYNNKQLNLQQDKAGWNIASSVVGLAGGVAVTVATGGAGVGSIMGGVGGIVNNAMNIEKITNEREKNNAKLYTSSKANDVTQNDKILNLRYGLIYVSTENYFNTEQVENYINDYGYTIDYKYCLKQMLKSITSVKYSFDSNGDETNTVDALTYFKYNRVDLNGNFSSEVRDGLKEIFRKGFKIVNRKNKAYFNACVSITYNKIL